MAITLITGSPGGGKSLFSVTKIVEELVPTGRKVYTNIRGFDHDRAGTHLPPFGEEPFAGRQWQECEDNSIIVLDEVQHAFPVRNPSARVPEFISAFETHRHRGLDLYLITQHPRYLDRHIWPLVERHHHLFRPHGLQNSRHSSWESVCENPEPLQSHETAQVHRFRFNPQYFEYYQSATLHTVKRTLPVKKLLIFGVTCAMGLGGFFYLFQSVRAGAPPVANASPSPTSAFSMSHSGGEPCALLVGRLGEKWLYQLPDMSMRIRWPLKAGEHVTPEVTVCFPAET